MTAYRRNLVASGRYFLKGAALFVRGETAMPDLRVATTQAIFREIIEIITKVETTDLQILDLSTKDCKTAY